MFLSSCIVLEFLSLEELRVLHKYLSQHYFPFTLGAETGYLKTFISFWSKKLHSEEQSYEEGEKQE